MARTKMRAQLRYEKHEDGREGYAINIFSEGSWGLDTWYPLVERKGSENGDTDYVHWSILRKLAELQAWGYDIDLMF